MPRGIILHRTGPIAGHAAGHGGLPRRQHQDPLQHHTVAPAGSEKLGITNPPLWFPQHRVQTGFAIIQHIPSMEASGITEIDVISEALSSDHEGMQMVVFPAHRDLEHVVHIIQGGGGGQPQASSDLRLAPLKGHLQLKYPHHFRRQPRLLLQPAGHPSQWPWRL
jgi:hypothetical protein